MQPIVTAEARRNVAPMGVFYYCVVSYCVVSYYLVFYYCANQGDFIELQQEITLNYAITDTTLH